MAERYERERDFTVVYHLYLLIEESHHQYMMKISDKKIIQNV